MADEKVAALIDEAVLKVANTAEAADPESDSKTAEEKEARVSYTAVMAALGRAHRDKNDALIVDLNEMADVLQGLHPFLAEKL